MSWERSHRFGAQTHDEYIARWREQQDALTEFFYDLPTDRADEHADRDHRDPRTRLGTT